MLVKCICTNCAGHLEFEEENAGEKIDCPHCGFETTLALPGTQAAEPELLAAIRRRALLRRLRPFLAAALVVAAFGYALYRWGVPWLQDFAPSLDTTGKAFAVLLVACAVLPFVLLWLVFPVFLFFQVRKGLGLLEELTQALKPRESEPAPAPDEPAADAGEEQAPPE